MNAERILIGQRFVIATMAFAFFTLGALWDQYLPRCKWHWAFVLLGAVITQVYFVLAHGARIHGGQHGVLVIGRDTKKSRQRQYINLITYFRQKGSRRKAEA